MYFFVFEDVCNRHHIGVGGVGAASDADLIDEESFDVPDFFDVARAVWCCREWFKYAKVDGRRFGRRLRHHLRGVRPSLFLCLGL